MVIETRDGRRHEVERAKLSDRSLAPRTHSVLAALSDEFTAPGAIAVRAGLPARTRIAEATRLCEYLVRIGLAERQEGGRWRRWRRASTGQHDLSA